MELVEQSAQLHHGEIGAREVDDLGGAAAKRERLPASARDRTDSRATDSPRRTTRRFRLGPILSTSAQKRHSEACARLRTSSRPRPFARGLPYADTAVVTEAAGVQRARPGTSLQPREEQRAVLGRERLAERARERLMTRGPGSEERRHCRSRPRRRAGWTRRRRHEGGRAVAVQEDVLEHQAIQIGRTKQSTRPRECTIGSPRRLNDVLSRMGQPVRARRPGAGGRSGSCPPRPRSARVRSRRRA